MTVHALDAGDGGAGRDRRPYPRPGPFRSDRVMNTAAGGRTETVAGRVADPFRSAAPEMGR